MPSSPARKCSSCGVGGHYRPTCPKTNYPVLKIWGDPVISYRVTVTPSRSLFGDAVPAVHPVKLPRRASLRASKKLVDCMKQRARLCSSRKDNGLANRRGDTAYWLIRDVVRSLDYFRNVPFTPYDNLQKLKIFDIKDCKTCVITGAALLAGRGDHLFEMRGYHRQTGRYGSDSEWNLVPVRGSLNKSYKVLRFSVDDIKWTKNIGHQLLSCREVKMCSREQLDIYRKIRRWMRYVSSRGARLSYRLPQTIEMDLDFLLDDAYRLLVTGTQRIVARLTSVLQDHGQ